MDNNQFTHTFKPQSYKGIDSN